MADTGAGIGGFAAGFGRGLSKALLTNRDRTDEKQKEERARKDRMFQALLPTMLQHMEDPADLEPLLTAQFPDIFGGPGGKKPKKGEDSPMAKIATVLGPFIGMRKKGTTGAGNDLPQDGGITGNMPRAGAGMTTDAIARRRQLGLPVAADGAGTEVGPTGAATGGALDMSPLTFDQGPVPAGMTPGVPTAPATAPATSTGTSTGTPAAPSTLTPMATTAATPPARRTLLGVPMMSAEEKQTRTGNLEASAAVGLMQRARDIVLPAMRAVDPAATIEDAIEVLNPKVNFGSMRAARTRSYGVDRDAIAKAMFDKPFGELTSAEAQAVIVQEQNQLEAEARARGNGTAQARFNAPADLTTAQATGVPVGTTAAAVAGQGVAPLPVQAQRRDLTTLKTDLTHIKTLLSVLPSKTESGGIAPGAVLAVKRRMNTSREDVAKLESAVDAIVNVLARTLGAQRGAQTEKDAERAYNTVIKLQAGLKDPFGGDTRESAAARIDETMAALDRVIDSLPTAPIVPPTPAAGAKKPAAGGGVPPAADAGAKPAGTAAPVAGAVIRDGKLYINGVLIP